MTNYINPSTYSGGTQQIVVAERAVSSSVDEAPFDDEQYVRVNGEWVPVDTPDIVGDTVAPSPPTGLAGAGTIASGGNAVNYSLTWVAPTTNVDATPLTDLAYYVVRWKYAGSGPWTSFVSDDTAAALPGLQLGVDIAWEVLARDLSGNDSTWAASSILGLVDTAGPEKPSIPALTTSLGTITARWDGLDHGGGAPPADFSHLEFFISATTGGPWAYVDRISGAGSAIITDIPVGDTRFVTTVAVDTSGNTSVRSGEASITVQGVTAPDMEANSVTANSVAAGSVAASKITTGELAAGVKIIAGDGNGNHAEMTDVGFKAFTADPEDGIPNEVVRMGSDTGDVFAVTDSAGAIKASISENGTGAFTGLGVDATEWDEESNPTKGLTVYGKEFLDYINDLPRGIVGHGRVTTSMSGITVTEQKFMELQVQLFPGRSYRIEVPSFYVSMSGTTTSTRIVNMLRYAFDAPVSITSSTLMTQRTWMSNAATNTFTSSPRTGSMVYTLNTGSWTEAKEIRLLLTSYLESAAPNTATVGIVASSGYPVEMNVYDEGRSIDDNSIDYTLAVPPITVKTYVSTWNASNSADYTGSNVADSYSDDLKHGYSSASGDSHACIVFASNAVSGETTKTIASALTGATLTKVEVYLYANHWWYSSGGTAIIRAYNSTSLSSSTPTGTIKSVPSWPKPGGKWVDITSVSTASIRGVTLGKAGSTNLTYYGRFNSHTQANKPQLRLTYKR